MGGWHGCHLVVAVQNTATGPLQGGEEGWGLLVRGQHLACHHELGGGIGENVEH